MNDFDDLPQGGGYDNGGYSSGGSYADEVFSEKLVARSRIFYVDVKESSNGRFLKVSEKSRGRRSTIMMDQEDVQGFIELLQKAQAQM